MTVRSSIQVIACALLTASACNGQQPSPAVEPARPKRNAPAPAPPLTPGAKPPNTGWAEQAALYASIAQAEAIDESWTTAERTRLDAALAGTSVPKIAKVSCHATLCVIELSEKVGAADLVVPLTQREVFVGQGFYIYGDGDRTVIYASRKGSALPTAANVAPPALAPEGGAP